MTKLMVVVGFLVSFSAGLVVGVRGRTEPQAGPTTQPIRRGSWLTSQLNLSTEQQDQFRKIWSETARRGGREQEERRRQLRKDRDDAIVAMIPPESRSKYDQVLSHYAEQTGALDREWSSSFRDAVDRTKQILTLEQRLKYEELLRRPEWDRGGRDGDRSGRDHQHGRRGDDRAASRPGSEK
jgi:Spy/CpxP family protein refolding chaperone